MEHTCHGNEHMPPGPCFACIAEVAEYRASHNGCEGGFDGICALDEPMVMKWCVYCLLSGAVRHHQLAVRVEPKQPTCATCEALDLSVVEPESELTVPMTEEELEWVEHGASLRGLTTVEYTRRAINAALRKQGVDAVLLAESDDELGACRHGVKGADHCPDCEAMKA